MSDLMNEYLDWIKKLEARNAHVLTFNCPCCMGLIKTIAPDVETACWDSLSQCPHCADMFWKNAYFDRVEVRTLEPYPSEANA